jgi:hypothetical protein
MRSFAGSSMNARPSLYAHPGTHLHKNIVNKYKTAVADGIQVDDAYAPAHGGAERAPVRVEERAHASGGGGVTAAAGSTAVTEPRVHAAQQAAAANALPTYLVNNLTQPICRLCTHC